jgi:hypothetical protein
MVQSNIWEGKAVGTPFSLGNFCMTAIRNLGVAAAMACCFAAPANAETVLDFTGVSTQTTHTATPLGGFYDGGVSGDGTSGPNLGVTFGGNTVVINNYNGCCEQQSSSGDKGVMTIMPNKFGDSITLISVPAGFGGFLTFDFASFCFTFVEIRSNADGTGDILSSGSFEPDNGPDIPCAPGATGSYCMWQTALIPFEGTAKSFYLSEGAPLSELFDRVTLGDAPVAGVPEPTVWVQLIAGFGMVGACFRRRRAAPLHAI